MQLMSATGQPMGHIEGNVPAGYWGRADDVPDTLSRLEFLDRFGPARFAVIWQAMQANPALAFQVMRGFAAETVYLEHSFPELLAMEQAGLVAVGTAIEVWS